MSGFKAQLDAAYQKKVVERLDKAVRLTALQVFTNLVKETPVDKGRARGNWNMDINIVDVKIDHAAVPGAKGDYDGIAKALAVTARYKTEDTIFISNNMPYIVRLNEGHSGQAPAGFVDAAIAIGKRQAQEIINKS